MRNVVAIDGFCNAVIGDFEVYSIASDKAISEVMSLSKALAEMEKLADAGGASNGMDIRRVR